MKNLFYSLFAVLILTSCTKEDIITDTDQLDRGGFAKFEGNPILTADLALGKYVATIVDANNNASSYKITGVSANIGGVSYPMEAISYSYTLPANVNINLSDLAAAFGLTSGDITYGDNFTLTAEVTTVDGRVFKGTSPADSNPGNTSPNLLNPGNGYRSAMNFKFTVACPSFDLSSMYGTYLISDTDWDEYAFRTPAGYTVQCVAGPRPNTLKFVNFSNVGTDLIVIVNPDAQSATSEKIKIYSNFYTYGDSFAEGKSGLVFSCIGVINLQMQYTVNAGTFGGLYNFILTKQ